MGGGWDQGECEQRFKVFVKMQQQKKNSGGSGSRGVGFGGSGWISEIFVKIRKKWGGGVESGGGGGGGQGGCKRKSEVSVEIKKNRGRGRVGRGVMVDVNEDLKLFEN